MDPPGDGVEPSAKGSGLFTTTHWSVVLAAGQTEAPQAGEALEKLCRTYWYPLYAYIRREGSGAADAQDLTQEFSPGCWPGTTSARSVPRKASSVLSSWRRCVTFFVSV
jgi:hypothetical protein